MPIYIMTLQVFTILYSPMCVCIVELDDASFDPEDDYVISCKFRPLANPAYLNSYLEASRPNGAIANEAGQPAKRTALASAPAVNVRK